MTVDLEFITCVLLILVQYTCVDKLYKSESYISKMIVFPISGALTTSTVMVLYQMLRIEYTVLDYMVYSMYTTPRQLSAILVLDSYYKDILFTKLLVIVHCYSCIFHFTFNMLKVYLRESCRLRREESKEEELKKKLEENRFKVVEEER